MSFLTKADRAALDVIAWELVVRIPEHRERCPRCKAEKETGWPCPRVGEAIEAVLDFHRGLELVRRAENYRRVEIRARLDEVREALAT